MTCALSIVTVSYGYTEELALSCDSVDAQSKKIFEHILVVSNISGSEQELLQQQYSNKVRKFIFNRDKSLYHAMNLGLEQVTGTHVLFLNAGDVFLHNDAYLQINTALEHDSCLLFKVNMRYKHASYSATDAALVASVNKTPCHQGFIAPVARKLVLFDLHLPINADHYWMQFYLANYQLQILNKELVAFELGGISNFPSIKSIKLRYQSSFKAALTELIKLSLRKLFGNALYYRFLMYKNGYILNKIENHEKSTNK